LLNPELGLINTEDPIVLYVAATGPRARALTAKLDAGWISTISDAEAASAALRAMQSAREAAGHAAAFDSVLLTGGAILEKGEPADSSRAIARAGPRAAMLLHRAADQALAGFPNTTPVPAAVAGTVAGYVELARGFRPQGAHYLENHRGHLMFVKPEERRFVTAERIRLTTLTATKKELKDRIAALFAAGYSEIAFKIVPGQEHAIEDWGKIRRAFA
jgi:5,10-methylenetetrahydromethanopterin reductase